MLFTVSTVKDTLPHVRRFVAGNLAGGVDHLVVVLDAPDAPGQAEVAGFLDAHEHVTCLRADDAWWAGDRPQQLNVRQRVNANLVKALLAGVEEADWLFHVDGDELVQVDRDVLAGVPADVVAVRLAVWETASQWRVEGEPRLFKHLLDDADLELLATLGVIDSPGNGRYFHGHVDGKSGVRPPAQAWLTLHRAVDAEREPLPSYGDPRLRVLHYESYSGEEFCRKWLAMLGSGPKASFRPARADTSAALRTLVDKGLPPERLEPYLRQVWEATTADDVETLADLGLLTELDPLAGPHVPAPLPPSAARVMAEGLAALEGQSKRRFHNARTQAEHAAQFEGAESPRAPGGDRSRRGWFRRAR